MTRLSACSADDHQDDDRVGVLLRRVLLMRSRHESRAIAQRGDGEAPGRAVPLVGLDSASEHPSQGQQRALDHDERLGLSNLTSRQDSRTWRSASGRRRQLDDRVPKIVQVGTPNSCDYGRQSGVEPHSVRSPARSGASAAPTSEVRTDFAWAGCVLGAWLLPSRDGEVAMRRSSVSPVPSECCVVASWASTCRSRVERDAIA